VLSRPPASRSTGHECVLQSARGQSALPMATSFDQLLAPPILELCPPFASARLPDVIMVPSWFRSVLPRAQSHGPQPDPRPWFSGMRFQLAQISFFKSQLQPGKLQGLPFERGACYIAPLAGRLSLALHSQWRFARAKSDARHRGPISLPGSSGPTSRFSASCTTTRPVIWDANDGGMRVRAQHPRAAGSRQERPVNTTATLHTPSAVPP